MEARSELNAIEQVLRRAAAVLRDAGIPFMLGGSLAGWARGGPRTDNDVDLMVAREDVEDACAALVRAGMRAETQPEDWLLKVYDGDIAIDLIHGPLGVRVTRATIEQADVLQVLAMAMPVMAIDDVLVSRLLALDEHRLDFTSLLQVARALREQVDWPTVVQRVEDHPPARAFLRVLAELGIINPSVGEHPRARQGAARVQSIGRTRDIGSHS